MTTFNFQEQETSICVDCTPREAAEFEAHIADLDRRIAAAKANTNVTLF